MKAGARFRAWTLAAIALAACARSHDRPSVLLVSIDTLRRDHVSAYGYAQPTTPVLDGLARQGSLFERALSTSNWTLPAHASLFTGLSPSRHRVEDSSDRLPDALHTLAESFHDAGYASAGFASHIYLDARYGFARGFDSWQVAPEQRASQVSDAAIAWLARQSPDEPFLLFLHYFDPHWDYDPPDRFWKRFGSPPRPYGQLGFLNAYRDPTRPMAPELLRDVAALYDAEIAYTDDELGRVVAWLREHRRLDTTVVAVVADHGEELDDHGGFGHGSHLHAELTDIPLILRYPPRIPAGTRRSDPVSLADLPATLLDLAKLDPQPQFLDEGRSLFGATSPPDERSLIAESTRSGPKRFALHRGSYVFLGGGSYRLLEFGMRRGKVVAREGETVQLEPQLFDQARDPTEQHDLLHVPGGERRAAELGAELSRIALSRVVGLRLSCPEAGAGPVEGELVFAKPLRDEPYVVQGSGDAAATVEEVEPKHFHVTIRPAPEPATVVFTTNRIDPSVSVELRDTEETTHQRISPSRATEGVRLGPGGRCRLEGRGLEGGGGSVELSPEQRERLRELGYAE